MVVADQNVGKPFFAQPAGLIGEGLGEPQRPAAEGELHRGDHVQTPAQAREIAELRAQSATEIAELKRAVEVLLARTSPEGRLSAR